MLALILELLGVVLVVGAIGVWSPVLAVLVAGVVLVLVGNAVDRGRS